MNDDKLPTNEEIDALKKVVGFLSRTDQIELTISCIGIVHVKDNDGMNTITMLTPIRLDMIRFGRGK